MTSKATNISHVDAICHQRLTTINPSTELKRHTGLLFYSLGKGGFRFLAKLFDLSPSTTYQ